MPKNWCFWIVVLGKTLENSLDWREIKPVNLKVNHWKDWCWSWSSNNLATWYEEPIHWKRLWCWKRLKAGGEAVNRGWDGWIASSTQWTWVWANSGREWRTRKPGVLQSPGSQSRIQLTTEQWMTNNAYILNSSQHTAWDKDVASMQKPQLLIFSYPWLWCWYSLRIGLNHLKLLNFGSKFQSSTT